MSDYFKLYADMKERIYFLTFTPSVLKEMVGIDTANHLYNYISSYKGGGWVAGKEFRKEADGGIGDTDLDSFKRIMNNKEKRIYDKDGYGKFDFDAFK